MHILARTLPIIFCSIISGSLRDVKEQVGQLLQTNRAAAWVSFGTNISGKSVASNIALSYGAKDI